MSIKEWRLHIPEFTTGVVESLDIQSGRPVFNKGVTLGSILIDDDQTIELKSPFDDMVVTNLKIKVGDRINQGDLIAVVELTKQSTDDIASVESKDVEVESKEVESKEVESKEVESKEVESKEVESKEVESKEVESKEVESKVESKEVESKEVESKEVESKEVESKEVESKEVESKEVESKEVESKEVESKEVESKEVESKEVESKEVESKEVESKEVESKEVESKEVESKEVEPEELKNTNETVSNRNDDVQTQENSQNTANTDATDGQSPELDSPEIPTSSSTPISPASTSTDGQSPELDSPEIPTSSSTTPASTEDKQKQPKTQESKTQQQEDGIELTKDNVDRIITEKNQGKKYALVLGLPSMGKSLAYSFIDQSLEVGQTFHHNQSTISGFVYKLSFDLDTKTRKKHKPQQVLYDVAGEDCAFWLKNCLNFASIRQLTETLQYSPRNDDGNFDNAAVKSTYDTYFKQELASKDKKSQIEQLNRLIQDAAKVYFFIAASDDAYSIHREHENLRPLGNQITQTGLKNEKFCFFFSHVDMKGEGDGDNPFSVKKLLVEIKKWLDDDTQDKKTVQPFYQQNIQPIFDAYVQHVYPAKNDVNSNNNAVDNTADVANFTDIKFNKVKEIEDEVANRDPYSYVYLLYPPHLVILQKIDELFVTKTEKEQQKIATLRKLINGEANKAGSHYRKARLQFGRDVQDVFDFDAQKEGLLDKLKRLCCVFVKKNKKRVLPVLLGFVFAIFAFCSAYNKSATVTYTYQGTTAGFTNAYQLKINTTLANGANVNPNSNPYAFMSVKDLKSTYSLLVLEYERGKEELFTATMNSEGGEVCTCYSVFHTAGHMSRYVSAVNNFYGAAGEEIENTSRISASLENIYDEAPVTQREQDACAGSSLDRFLQATQSDEDTRHGTYLKDESGNTIARNEIRECLVILHDFWDKRVKLAKDLDNQETTDVKDIKTILDIYNHIYAKNGSSQYYEHLAKQANIADNIIRERLVLSTLNAKLNDNASKADININLVNKNSVQINGNQETKFLTEGNSILYQQVCPIKHDFTRATQLLCDSLSNVKIPNTEINAFQNEAAGQKESANLVASIINNSPNHAEKLCKNELIKCNKITEKSITKPIKFWFVSLPVWVWGVLGFLFGVIAWYLSVFVGYFGSRLIKKNTQKNNQETKK